MKVFRVEHRLDRSGPYRSKHELDRLIEVHNNDGEHPSPKHDYIDEYTSLGITRDEICGFKSIKALKRWFFGFRTMLRENDFVLAVYETSSYRVSPYTGQTVFVPYTRIKEMKLP